VVDANVDVAAAVTPDAPVDSSAEAGAPDQGENPDATEAAAEAGGTPGDAADGGSPAMDAGAAEAQPGDSFDGDDGEATGDGDDEASLGDDEASLDAGPGWQTENDAALTIEAGVGNDAGVLSLQCLSLLNQDLVFDPSRSVLYASIPGSSSAYGNCVVRIDPGTLSVTGSVFVGSNPDALAITDDAETLYVGIDGAYSLVEVALATGEVSAPVYLGTSPTFGGPTTAGQIRAVPGSRSQYVVSRRYSAEYNEVASEFSGLALYDGSTLLGSWNGVFGADAIAFTSPTTLYGFDDEDSSFYLYQFTVSSSGFAVASDVEDLISGYTTEITSEGGWLFATSGQAVNGATMLPVGQYDAVGTVWPAPNGTDVWYLTLPGAYGESNYGSSVPALYDFDRATFTARRSFQLPFDTLDDQTPTRLVGWSATGFAFRNSAYICTLNVPSP
jgi:hypothetical protein